MISFYDVNISFCFVGWNLCNVFVQSSSPDMFTKSLQVGKFSTALPLHVVLLWYACLCCYVLLSFGDFRAKIDGNNNLIFASLYLPLPSKICLCRCTQCTFTWHKAMGKCHFITAFQFVQIPVGRGGKSNQNPKLEQTGISVYNMPPQTKIQIFYKTDSDLPSHPHIESWAKRNSLLCIEIQSIH